jgi:hypothetical protein
LYGTAVGESIFKEKDNIIVEYIMKATGMCDNR